MQNVYDILNKLNIPFEKYDHPAVFTVEESKKIDSEINAGKTKNLFLRNLKETQYYLIIIAAESKVNIKELAKTLNESKFSFGSPEKMHKLLGLTPGSVSPFGLLNNKEKNIKVIVDQNLLKCEKLAFHPNLNTATLVIKTDDFKKFLKWTGNPSSYIQIPLIY